MQNNALEASTKPRTRLHFVHIIGDKMPFLAQEHLPISNKDILSWIFDEPKYDLDKPVSRMKESLASICIN